MVRLLQLIFALLFIAASTNTLRAQCDEPAPPGTDCESAPILCDFDLEGYCSTNPPDPNNIAPPGFCAGSVDNCQWIAFVAGSTSLQLTITVQNCQGSNQPPGGGIQAQLFGQNSDCDDFFPVSNCYTDGVPNGTVVLTTTQNLIIGNIYYFIVDGWAFDQCNWSVSVTQGNVSPPNLTTPGPISGPLNPCPGLITTYSVPPSVGANNYDWTIDCGTILSGQGTTAITVQLGAEGPCQICVEAQAPCSDPASLCMDINVEAIPETYIDTVICQGQSVFWCGNLQTQSGSIPCTFQTDIGCDSTVILDLQVAFPTYGQIELLLCENESQTINTPNGPVTFSGSGGPSSSELLFPGANVLGCDSFLTVIVNVEYVALVATPLDETCFGNGDGSILITPILGTPPFDFDWDPSYLDGEQNPVNLPPGTYNLTMTSSFGCTTTETIEVGGPDEVEITVEEVVDVTCPGGDDGSITISASGGSIALLYFWSDPNIGNATEATSLSAGTYTVTVQDVFGCSAIESIDVNEPEELVIDVVEANNIGCNGETNGSILVAGSGGTGPYTFDWNPADLGQTDNPTNLTAGIYSVTMTDSEGCTTNTSIEIIEPDPIIGTITPEPLGCFGDNSGSITIELEGGTTPFSFNWSDATIGDVQNPAGLAAGDYNVTVTDASGCSITLQTTVTQPNGINITATGTDLACNGNGAGSISTTTSGGTGPYTYNWNDPLIGGLANPTGLDAGVYSVTVTDTKGCTATTSVTLNEPPLLELTVDNSTNITCNGENDGSIAVSSAGGVEPYTYSWNLSSIGNNANPQNLAPGSYQVTVTDANSCTASASVTITEPPVLAATAVPSNLACNADGSGSIDVTVTGGTPGYSYAWSDNTLGDTEDPAGLAAGSYTVTVTDANGCSTEVSVTITQPAALTLTTQPVNLDCNGDNSGSINIIATGGTAPYQYDWNDGTIGDVSNPTGLAAGFYEVTVSDANGCTQVSSATLTEPDLLDLTLVGTDVNCFEGADGVIDATVAGGTTPYSFSWSDPAIGNVEDASGLIVGDYSLTVTDANGCTAVASATLDEPTALSISGSSTDATCGESNGSIDITIGGGVAPYNFSWNNSSLDGEEDPQNLSPGTYTVTVTDDNGCTITLDVPVNTPTGLTASIVSTAVSCNGGNDGSLDMTITGGIAPYQIVWDNPAYAGIEDPDSLVAGLYNVTVSDADGCSVTASSTVNQPPVLVVTATSIKAICGEANGSINTTITGGTSPYIADWNIDSLDGIQDPSGLLPGTYTVDIIDANGCVASTSIDVTAPDELIASSAATAVGCFGENSGALDISVSGGTTPYVFTWNNPVYNGLEDLNNITSGIYTITVTDADGCTVVVSDTISQPEQLAVSPSFTNVNCNGAADGTITLDVTGGTAPYAFDWNNNNLDTIQNPTGLAPGTYNVTITDANGCSVTNSTAITQPPVLQVFGSTTPAICGEPNGSIDMTIQGGTLPYTITWSDTTLNGLEDPTNLGPATYTVTVMDGNDCAVSTDFTVITPNALVISAVVTDVSCFGSSSGAIDVTLTGGTAPYNFNWSDDIFDNQQDVANCIAGDYQLIVTDKDGCSIVLDETVGEPALLEATTNPSDVVCNGAGDGTIDLTVTGGVAPYNFTWSNPAYNGTEDPANLVPGNYKVTVTDDNACTVVANATIAQPAALSATDIITDADCNSAASGSVDLTVTGGIAPYTFDWDDDTFDGQEDPMGMIAGNYQVIITDANNCTLQYNVQVDQPAGLSIDETTIVNVDCNGNSTGSAEIKVSGGVKPYTINWSGGAIGVFAPNLAAADYFATITDANGCELISNAITVTEPEILEVTGLPAQATCDLANGSIDLTVTGGTAPFTFDWSDNSIDGQEDPQNILTGNYSVTVTDVNGCTAATTINVPTPPALEVTASPMAASCFDGDDGSIGLDVTGGTAPFTFDWSDNSIDGQEDPSGLTAGNYTVTVTDANNCFVVVAVTVTEPTQLTVNTSANQATCGLSNGSISLTVLGGTAPYSFDWDDDNLDGIEDPQNLFAGNYTLTITDDNGCTIETSVNVPTPNALEATISSTDALCFGANSGTISLNVTGGTTPYNFDWSDNAFDGIEDPAQVTAGDYSVTITDADGCQVILSTSIAEPELLATSGTPSSVSCNGGNNGSIDLTVSGGTPPYNFQWNNGASPVEDPANLTANVYSVTVTDDQGCTATTTVNVGQPQALQCFILSVTDARCKDGSDGSINMTVAGGTPPYNYNWSNGGGNQQDPQNLSAGNYTVTVTDANSCTATISATVGEPEGLNVSVTVSDYGIYNVSCYDSQDGSIQVVPNGGTPPYVYTWNTGADVPRLTDLGPGNYSLTLTDDLGCSEVVEVTLTAPPAIFASLSSQGVTCYGDEDGAIFIENVTGGIPPYRYELNNGEEASGFPSFGFLDAADYVVTVYDAEGCSWNGTITVEEPAELTVDLGLDVNLILGDSIELIANASDPFNLASVRWTGLVDTGCVNCLRHFVRPFETSDYSVTIIDSSGCVATDDIRLRVVKERPIYIPTAFSPNGDGYNDRFYIGGGNNVVQVEQLQIFNRWGEQVFSRKSFQPNDPAEGWDGVFDGKLLDPDVFVYYAEISFIDGEVILYKGSVTLVR